jgi:hypothetical protein
MMSAAVVRTGWRPAGLSQNTPCSAATGLVPAPDTGW